MAQRKNSTLDDVGDAHIYIRRWRDAASLQGKRLEEPTHHELIDVEFAILAVENLVQGCEMVAAHDFASVIKRMTEHFRKEAPWLKELRNAVEHFDDYLRGTGNASKGHVWFYLRLERRDGSIYLGIPPLKSAPKGGPVNITALVEYAVQLANEVLKEMRSFGFLTALRARYEEERWRRRSAAASE